MNRPVPYTTRPWPRRRNNIVSLLEAQRPHTVFGAVEVDVTAPLARIAAVQRQLRHALSFHAYVLWCFGQTVGVHKQVQAFRWRGRVILFDDVDISTVVEKPAGLGLRIPLALVVRSVQARSHAQVQWEIRQALLNDGSAELCRWGLRLERLPGFVRSILWSGLFSHPFLHKRFLGTVGLTNLQVPGMDRRAYAFPPNPNLCTLAIGNFFSEVRLDEDGQARRHRLFTLGASCDHEVIDGAPLMRAACHLAQMIERSVGLDDPFVTEMCELLQPKYRNTGVKQFS
jgi:hypothetical protein